MVRVRKIFEFLNCRKLGKIMKTVKIKQWFMEFLSGNIKKKLCKSFKKQKEKLTKNILYK